MLKQKKFIIGGLLIIAAVGYLAYSGFQNSSAYYYTISEVLEQGNTLVGENMRVDGIVDGSSIQSDSGNLVLDFVITEGDLNMPVHYRGVNPNNFQADIEVVVEGTMDNAGVFQAENIITKCPSKYTTES